MKRKITRFARAGNWGGRAARASPCCPCASARRPASASEPKPAPQCRSMSRLVIIASVHEQELVRRHQGMDDVRPRRVRGALLPEPLQGVEHRADLVLA